MLVLAASDDSQSETRSDSVGRARLSGPSAASRSNSKPRFGALSFIYTESTESEILADEIEQIGDDMFFVAASPTMRKLRAQAELLAQVSAPVLISGREWQRQGSGGLS